MSTLTATPFLAALLTLCQLTGAVAGSPSARAVLAEILSIEVGASEVIRTRPGVSTIILGNPDVAEASVVNPTTIAISGKLAGFTNLILLDASGDEMSRLRLQIGSRQTHIVVFGGVKVQNYSCAPSCVTTPDAAPLASGVAVSAPQGSDPRPHLSTDDSIANAGAGQGPQ